MDTTLRPMNSLVMLGLQSAAGVVATLSATAHAVPCEVDSISYNSPFKSEDTNEATGTLDAGAPLVVGQAATFSFRARLRGAGLNAVYTSTLKPPLHASLAACGWQGVFTASVSAAALTAGTSNSGTLGTGFAATAQAYRGMPLILSGGAPADGRVTFIADYSAAKVATLTDDLGSALSAANSAAIPANWLYTPTSPGDAASRAAMNPYATIQLNEDGVLKTWTDCRGVFEPDGDTAKPGFGTFSFTGIYQGETDSSMPSTIAMASQAAPMLAQGAGGLGSIFMINRKGLPISKWSLKANSTAESPDDPNTPYGFAGGELSGRKYVLSCDPKKTYVATRAILSEIATFQQYPGALYFPSAVGNRVGIVLPKMQPTDAAPDKAGNLRTEQTNYQAIAPGKDAAGRDGTVSIVFF